MICDACGNQTSKPYELVVSDGNGTFSYTMDKQCAEKHRDKEQAQGATVMLMPHVELGVWE